MAGHVSPCCESGWWFLPNPVEQYAQVKLGSFFFRDGGEHFQKKCVKIATSSKCMLQEKRNPILKVNMMPNEAPVATFLTVWCDVLV